MLRATRKNPVRHECYTVCFVMLKFMPDKAADGVYLVHGTPVLTKSPHNRFGHAWIETKDSKGQTVVIDPMYPQQRWPKDHYYQTGQLTEEHVVRYNWFAAKRLERDTDSTGPWDEKITAAAHSND